MFAASTDSTALFERIDEQTAAVLSDMDAELPAVEKPTARTRALKQAMMPELLTGKTRLVMKISGILDRRRVINANGGTD